MASISVPSLIQDSANLETQTGRQRTQGDPNAWGAQEARGLAQVGAGLEHAAQAADEIELRFDQANARELDNAYAEYERQALYDPSTGYLSQRGKNALEARPGLQAGLDARLQQLADTARSNRARAAFLAVGGERMQNALQRADTHATEQVRVYEDAASTARMDQAASTAEADFGDDTNVLRQRDIINAEVAASGRRNGYDDAIISDNQMRHDQALARGIIGMRADADPAATRRALTAEHRTGVAALLSEGDRLSALQAIDRELQRRNEIYRSHVRENIGDTMDLIAAGGQPDMSRAPSIASAYAIDPALGARYEIAIASHARGQELQNVATPELEAMARTPPLTTGTNEERMHRQAQIVAAQNLLVQRQDPMQYAMDRGIVNDAPAMTAAIQSNDFNAVGRLLRGRTAAAIEQTVRLATPPAPLTASEAQAIRHQLDGLHGDERVAALATLRAGAGTVGFRHQRQNTSQSDAVYGVMLRQIYGDTPGAMGGASLLTRRGTVSVNNQNISGEQAGRYLLAGSALLNPPPTQRDETGRPIRQPSTFNMPSDAALDGIFNTYVGDAYKGEGAEGLREMTRQAFAAYLAGAASERGIDVSSLRYDVNHPSRDPNFGASGNDQRAVLLAREALSVVVGEMRQNTNAQQHYGEDDQSYPRALSAQTYMPFGMSVDEFNSSVRAGWPAIRRGHPELGENPNAYDFRAVGGGDYAVFFNGLAVTNNEGQPVTIRPRFQ